MTIHLEKDLVIPNLPHKLLSKHLRKKRLITKLRLMLRPRCSQVLQQLLCRMIKLELDKKPRLLSMDKTRRMLLQWPPDGQLLMHPLTDFFITLMDQPNSQEVESSMAPTMGLVKTKAKLPSKMKMVKSMRLSILPELSHITIKILACNKPKTTLLPNKDKRLMLRDSLTPMLISMVSTMPQMDMLSSLKVENSAV